MIVACCRTLWPMGNIAVFTGPVESVPDLANRTETAHKFLVARGCSGVFFMADNLVEPLRAKVAEVFACFGYAAGLTVMGIAAHALKPPLRPLPPMRYRAVTDSESRRIVFVLNAIAHEVPPEWGLDYNERVGIWDREAFGVIGHLDERPTACAVTVPLNGRLYVALVATAHEFRRLGCAEAVIRRSLDDAARATGLSRTILHASPMGHPLYSQMGHHDTVPFTVYARAEGMG